MTPTAADVDRTPHLRALAGVVTVLSLIAIACATLFPAIGEEPVGSHFCFVCGTAGGVDIVLNIILFIPLGVGLAMLGVPARRAILLSAATSLLIESAQFTIIPGRDATIGDVLTNSVGGAVGFCAAYNARRWLRPAPRHAMGLLAAWAAVWLAIQIVSSAAFRPAPTELQYYGQLAPVLGHFARFQGQVLAAQVGDLPISSTLLADGRRLRQLILEGAASTATVTTVAPSRGTAPILRVVDAHGREIILLAERGEDFVFATRTIAAALKLRAPQFALPKVFGQSGIPSATNAAASADSLRLGGQYLASEVSLRTSADAASRRVIPINASLAWTLLLPSQWYVRGSEIERMLSWVWIAGLLIPLGYWAALSVGLERPRRLAVTIATAAFTIVVLYGGFGLAPRMFGLSVTTVGEWVAGFGGIIIGALLARVGGTRKQTAHGTDTT